MNSNEQSSIPSVPCQPKPAILYDTVVEGLQTQRDWRRPGEPDVDPARSSPRYYYYI